MNSASKSFLLTSILLLTLLSVSNAGGTDNWFSRDKFQHFGYSAFLAGGTFAVSERHFNNNKSDSFAISVSITFSLGAAKEVIDYRKPGQTASFKDLIFDIAGAVTGASIASMLL